MGITNKLTSRFQQVIARLGVHLISGSKVANGYWRPWRLSFFDFAQSKGLHILPVHYYTPIPDTRELDDDQGPKYKSHIDYNAENAFQQIQEFMRLYCDTFEDFRTRSEFAASRYTYNNNSYHPCEAEVLYSIIRSTKPKRIIEIGCGVSTLVMVEAIADAEQDDPGYSCNLTCVEPYRPDYLSDPPPQISEFLDLPVQKLTPEAVSELEAGDILFIDSTHVVAPQSDVLHEIMNLLPALKPGVMIHVHDIFLPYDYPSKWMHEARFFWAEQYMLYAYLLGNETVEVVLPLHMLSRQREEEMLKFFPEMRDAKMPPSALWLRTK
jgi:hypothetical protein